MVSQVSSAAFAGGRPGCWGPTSLCSLWVSAVVPSALFHTALSGTETKNQLGPFGQQVAEPGWPGLPTTDPSNSPHPKPKLRLPLPFQTNLTPP